MNKRRGQVVEIPCPLCRARDYVKVMRARGSITPEREWFTIVKCRACGHFFTNPRPDATAMARYYQPEYWPVSHGAPDLNTLSAGGLPWRRIMLERAEPILRHKKQGTILEVGCGDGLFLYYLWERGWTVRGIEPGRSAAQYARSTLKLDVIHGRLEEFDSKGGTFDVVYLHHVLEHTDRPLQILRRARRLLAASGLLVIVVPSFSSFDRRLFGPYWRGLGLPIHLHHFTPRRLRELFCEAGLMPSEARFFSNSGRWPANYSDSIRAFLQGVGLKRPPKQASIPTGAKGERKAGGELLSTGRPMIDLFHRFEYGFFCRWGDLMDKIGMGSSVLMIGSARSR